ncbi:hypothetical protein MRB53_038001 [Persea americana]|nr:hypothetical protein MRB53_038001 [Persea americana]
MSIARRFPETVQVHRLFVRQRLSEDEHLTCIGRDTTPGQASVETRASPCITTQGYARLCKSELSTCHKRGESNTSTPTLCRPSGRVRIDAGVGLSCSEDSHRTGERGKNQADYGLDGMERASDRSRDHVDVY